MSICPSSESIDDSPCSIVLAEAAIAGIKMVKTKPDAEVDSTFRYPSCSLIPEYVMSATYP